MSQRRLSGACCIGGLMLLATSPAARSAGDLPAPDAVLATVDGRPVTERELQAMFLARDVPRSLQPAVRKAFLQRLIDNRLMRDFLKQRKVEPAAKRIDDAVRKFHRQIKDRGEDPAKVLKQRGLDEAALRRELWLPLAWHALARRIVTDTEIRKRFKQSPWEFDGTRVRARQIVLRLPASAGESTKRAALEKLKGVREQVSAGKLSFAEAARKFSQAPSKDKGGDVGEFPYRGKMPAVIAERAFRLKKGEIGRPFLTPFGAHLLQVTERKPGQLSLEDARPVIFRELSRRHWDEIVARLRKTAKIEWKQKP